MMQNRSNYAAMLFGRNQTAEDFSAETSKLNNDGKCSRSLWMEHTRTSRMCFDYNGSEGKTEILGRTRDEIVQDSMFRFELCRDIVSIENVKSEGEGEDHCMYCRTGYQ